MRQKVKKSVSLLPEGEEKIILEILNFRNNLSIILISLPGTSDSIEAGQGRPPIWCRSRSPKIPNAAVPSSLVDTGRTMEQVSYFQIASLLAFASAKLGLLII